MAVVQQSIEFAISYLEGSALKSDDLSIQVYDLFRKLFRKLSFT